MTGPDLFLQLPSHPIPSCATTLFPSHPLSSPTSPYLFLLPASSSPALFCKLFSTLPLLYSSSSPTPQIQPHHPLFTPSRPPAFSFYFISSVSAFPLRAGYHQSANPAITSRRPAKPREKQPLQTTTTLHDHLEPAQPADCSLLCLARLQLHLRSLRSGTLR